ncbi:MAG: hypothetical protein K5931_00590 [Lachnospiraceae bacterium]|nr:hypothetical protein [Lachnospiraceae bacterium]
MLWYPDHSYIRQDVFRISEDSDPEVIKLESNGKITALKAGEAYVYSETGGVENGYHIIVSE